MLGEAFAHRLLCGQSLCSVFRLPHHVFCLKRTVAFWELQNTSKFKNNLISGQPGLLKSSTIVDGLFG